MTAVENEREREREREKPAAASMRKVFYEEARSVRSRSHGDGSWYQFKMIFLHRLTGDWMKTVAYFCQNLSARDLLAGTELYRQS